MPRRDEPDGDVLVVDDDEPTRRRIELALEEEGFRVFGAEDADDAREAVELNLIDAILLDHDLGSATGLELLPQLQEIDPYPAVVFLTGQGSVEVAKEAMSRGAVDYLVKSDEVYDELPSTLRRTIAGWSGIDRLGCVEDETPEPPDSLDTLAENSPLDALFLVQDDEVVFRHGTDRSSVCGVEVETLADWARRLTQLLERGENEAVSLVRRDDVVFGFLEFDRTGTVVGVMDAGAYPDEVDMAIRRAWAVLSPRLDEA